MNIESKRISQKGDFFTLFIELYFAKYVKGIEINEELFAASIKEFYDAVDAIPTQEIDQSSSDESSNSDIKEYKIHVTQGINHRGARIARGKTIENLILSAKK